MPQSRPRPLPVDLSLSCEASRLIGAWPSEIPFTAQAALDQRPQLRESQSALVKVVLEEYIRRADAGDAVSAEEFASQFPSIERSVLVLQLAAYDGLFDAALEQSWPNPGERFLDFELLEPLGRGGFARVFLAREHSAGGRKVVLKVCPRGAVEANVLGPLTHEHIVPVLSAKEDAARGLVGLCMPYLSRATLHDVLQRLQRREWAELCGEDMLRVVAEINETDPELRPRSTPPGPFAAGPFSAAATDLARQLVEAVAAVHAAGVRHGDLKPANLLLTADGRLILIDFNLALRGCATDQLLGGTLPYMAPEQLRRLCDPDGDSVPLDERSDLYSLGATLYELLTGRRAFEPEPTPIPTPDDVRRLLAMQTAGAVPLRDVNPQIDAELAGLVERCLAFDPGDRPRSAAELLEALPSQPLPVPARSRLRRVGLGVTAAALVVALGLGAVLLLPPDPEKAPSSAHLGTGADARDPARAERHAQWMAEGSAALDAGDGPAAVAAFRRIVAESPGRQEARFGLGRAYLLTEQYDAAAAEFTAIEDHATSGPVLAGLAHCWTKRFDYVKAAELYEQALTEGFRTPAVLNNLGYCLQQSHENWPRARDVLLAAVAKDPRFVPAWDGLAQLECKECLRDSERVPDMTFIERALAEESQSRELHFLAAWLYTFSAERSISAQDAAMNDDGNLARALEHCIQAVELGFDPARLRREMERFSALKRDPRFTEALQRPADRNTPEPVQHVVDPLAGLSPAIPLGTRPVSTSPPD